ncbi:hypothetical protein [Intrasporangium sp. YIM S08009]|uniref:hypothetical protein n=1 Tax=Intrasporangium zincisolvens TaxID=3080018 RepID=UPI002B05D5EA|nr:hypothetical protein [Intrasporangium sp. YIM S08009]
MDDEQAHDDENELLDAWISARVAYDEVLERLFLPTDRMLRQRPDKELVEEASRARALEEVARRRYYASRGMSDDPGFR